MQKCDIVDSDLLFYNIKNCKYNLLYDILIYFQVSIDIFH